MSQDVIPKMSTKRKLSLSTPQPAKKERKAIDLTTKMQVIKQYEGGNKVNAITRDLKLSHSTVSLLCANIKPIVLSYAVFDLNLTDVKTLYSNNKNVLYNHGYNNNEQRKC